MPLRREGSAAEEEDFAVLGIGIKASFSMVVVFVERGGGFHFRGLAVARFIRKFLVHST
jgi:hypothetical protein